MSDDRRGWFSRLREGLSKSSTQLTAGINAIFTRRRLDDEALGELEELLIASDMGVGVAEEVVEALRRTRFGQDVSPDEIRTALAAEVARLVEPVAKPLRLDPARKPNVVLVVGVNGSGKTTTVGKLAHRLSELGQQVVIGAADTFRAAAIDQLAIWAERSGAQLVRQGPGADPGAVAFDAVASGTARGADVVLIDTAGRLQTQHNLMEELRKVYAVVGKASPDAPHETLLVLDATTGQNGLSQARLFGEAVPLTGVIVTKLDGSAKGGIAVAINRELGIPVKLIGVGEKLEDLQPFDAAAYAQAIFAPGDAA